MSGFDAVVFDIGETLLDRTREYAAWAAFFGVPAHTFSAVFGSMVARGASVSDVLEFFWADSSGPKSSSPESARLTTLFQRRADAGDTIILEDRDLYPDARRAIRDLKDRGYVVGIAGNQPASVSEQLRDLELGADFIGSSTEWQLSKPKAEFFERAAHESGTTPARTIYVGDQLDNDVLAPMRAGLTTVRILRGPWGYLNRDENAESGCLAVIRSLDELAPILGRAGLSEHSGTQTTH